MEQRVNAAGYVADQQPPPAPDPDVAYQVALLLNWVALAGPPFGGEADTVPGAYYLALAPAVAAAFHKCWFMVDGEYDDAKEEVRALPGSAHAFGMVEALLPAAIRFGMAVERELARPWCDHDEFVAAVAGSIQRTVGA